MENELKLEGKTALVTGALSGLGLDTVKLLLKENVKGIVLIDIAANEDLLNELRQIRSDADILYRKCDVTNLQELEEAYTAGWNHFGYIDIAVHSAGIWNESKWRQVISTNVIGVMDGSMWLRNKMRKDRGGRGGVILNLSSLAGITHELPFCPIYSASKFAVRVFTTNMGHPIHYDMTGVRFLTICPDITDTPMIKGVKSVDDGIELMFQNELNDYTIVPISKVSSAIIDMCKTAKSGEVWMWDDCAFKEFLPISENIYNI